MLGLLSLGLVAGAAEEKAQSVQKKITTRLAKKSGKLPAAVLKAVEKGDYAAAQQALVVELKQCSDFSPVNARTLRLAMMHEWIRVTGAGVLTEMAGDDKEKCRFLAEF